MWRCALGFLCCLTIGPAAALAQTHPPDKPKPAAAKTPAKAKRGWNQVSPAQRKRVDAFARRYMGYLADAKTPRRAVRGLVRVFKPGAHELAGKAVGHAPGSRYWFVQPSGDAAAFVRLGQRPLSAGVRIIIASVDAPRIDLKQQPIYAHLGFTMLDTELYGHLDLKSWLSRPLALYVHARAANKTIDFSVGERASDPVLVIPDLLPHLSRKAQHKKVVDKAERMDAVAARKQGALVRFLRRHGVSRGLLQAAETSLVPAGKPSFIGVDRALIAGYAQSHNALAYAAVRAMVSAPKTAIPYRTAIVIAISKRHIGYTGKSGLAFVKTAMSRIIGAFGTEGVNTDMLGVRRIYARSAALLAAHRGGKANHGLVLNPRGDDALPGAIRRVLNTLAAAKAQYQIVSTPAWSRARGLSTLDMDVMDVGLPITGEGTPMELLSTLDLYQARLGFYAWLMNK